MNNLYQNILVAVDGSEASEAAVDKAIDISLDSGAALQILQVIDTKGFGGSYGDIVSGDVIYQVFLNGQEYLTQLLERAKAKGVDNVSQHIRFGNPKQIITHDYPDDHQVDLTIVGASGLSFTERLLLGSVAEFTQRHASSDVLIVRTKE